MKKTLFIAIAVLSAGLTSAFSADFPLLIQFKQGANTTNTNYTVTGFAAVNGTPVSGNFQITNTGSPATASIDGAPYHVGDVVTVTGGFTVPADDGKKDKKDEHGQHLGHQKQPGAEQQIECPAKQVHVIAGGTNGFFECGPVEFSYSPDTNTCTTVCN